MKRLLFVLVALASACRPALPTPPAPSGYDLFVRVLDDDGMPIVGAVVYGDWDAIGRYAVFKDGRTSFHLQSADHTVCAEVFGQRKCAPVTEAKTQEIVIRFGESR